MNVQRVGMLTVCWLMCVVVGEAEPRKEAPTEATLELKGTLTPIAKLMEKQKVVVDADAGMALVTAEGKVYPLMKDKTSRFLFMDKRLHERTIQVTAKLVAGTGMAQLTEVYTLKEGKLHDVYYWCQNCALRASEPGACLCCGAMTELVEVPLPKK